MTIAQEMHRAARRARNLLNERVDLVAGFLRSQTHTDGGFRGRTGQSDLYYSVFGIEGLLALGAETPAAPLAAYLRRFGGGESLDLVHLACLARCWGAIGWHGCDPRSRGRIHDCLNGFRADDDPAFGSAYGCFLAVGAWQDLRRGVPNPDALAHCLEGLQTPDGGYANDPRVPAASAPATAAAVTALRHLGRPVPPEAARWLLDRHRERGGFAAMPAAPDADLLSTATALHALAGMNVSLGERRSACLDFVNGLWSDEGAFRGSDHDGTLDCEYTYYGLLALGHLGEAR